MVTDRTAGGEVDFVTLRCVYHAYLDKVLVPFVICPGLTRFKLVEEEDTEEDEGEDDDLADDPGRGARHMYTGPKSTSAI